MIDGRNFDLEIQVICEPKFDNNFGKKLALSFLFKVKYGSKNYFVDSFDMINLPDIEDPLRNLNEIFRPIVPKANRAINLEDIFHTGSVEDSQGGFLNDQFSGFFSYYKYEGSLTSPTCDGNF